MRKLLVAIAAIMAMQISPAFAVERDVIERAKLAFSEQLGLTSSTIGEFAWIAEDAVYQYPLNDINVKLRVEGRDAIAVHLRALFDVAPNTEVANVSYYPTLDRDVVFVRYDLVAVDGSDERRSTVAIITMRGDQIVEFTQLNQSAQNLEVLNKSSGYFN
ncbi:MAG: nuclear transport factor 2 family protein [Betaproteobacteria bacterium]|nr:MAG: nuclear transport factor 2 family protein [Betaproteobacteria bacterium]